MNFSWLDSLEAFRQHLQDYAANANKERQTALRIALNSKTGLLGEIGEFIKAFNRDSLERMVHHLYKKWPHTKTKEILREGIKREIQARFYKEIYGHPPSKTVLTRDGKALLALNLKEHQEHQHLKQSDSTPTPVHKKKIKEGKDEISTKIINSDLDQLIKWALDLGVDKNRLDLYKSKPVGLAKMNMGNIIRKKLQILQNQAPPKVS